MKWTPFFGPGSKVVFVACSALEGSRTDEEEEANEAQSGVRGEGRPGSVAGAGIRGGDRATGDRATTVDPTVVYKWERQLAENVSRAFEAEGLDGDVSERESELLKKIGELTIERGSWPTSSVDFGEDAPLSGVN